MSLLMQNLNTKIEEMRKNEKELTEIRQKYV